MFGLVKKSSLINAQEHVKELVRDKEILQSRVDNRDIFIKDLQAEIKYLKEDMRVELLKEFQECKSEIEKVKFSKLERAKVILNHDEEAIKGYEFMWHSINQHIIEQYIEALDEKIGGAK